MLQRPSLVLNGNDMASIQKKTTWAVPSWAIQKANEVTENILSVALKFSNNIFQILLFSKQFNQFFNYCIAINKCCLLLQRSNKKCEWIWQTSFDATNCRLLLLCNCEITWNVYECACVWAPLSVWTYIRWRKSIKPVSLLLWITHLPIFRHLRQQEQKKSRRTISIAENFVAGSA